MLYQVFTTLVVIGTDCIGRCKSNYHSIMTTTAPSWGGGGVYLPIHYVVEYLDRQFIPNSIKTFWSYDISEDNIVKR